jgi:hypothetical protein
MTWSWRSNSNPKRSGRSRLAAGLVRVTKKGRRLSAVERREIEARLRAEGRLGGTENAVGTRT